MDGSDVEYDDILTCGDHQLVARFNKAVTLRQLFQEHELGDGKRHVAAGPGHPVPGRVHFQPPPYDPFGGSRTFVVVFAEAAFGPAQHRPYSRDQQTVGKGFGDVRSEEHTSELQSLMRISYAVFCLKKKQYQYHTSPTTKHTSVFC